MIVPYWVHWKCFVLCMLDLMFKHHDRLVCWPFWALEGDAKYVQRCISLKEAAIQDAKD